MPEVIRFRNDTLEIGFSPADGAPCALSLAGDAARSAGVLPGPAGIDARLGAGDWLSERHRPRLEAHRSTTRPDGALEIVLTVRQGPLRYFDAYVVRGRLIERRIRVENASRAEVQLNGVRLVVPAVRLGHLAECRLEAPATNVRPHVSLAVAAGERAGEPPSPLFAPAARDRWDRAIEDAPDVTPGVLAVHNARLGQSVMVWYFSDVEAATPRVDGLDEAVSLMHELGLAAWLAPGAHVDGGTQYLAVHQGNWDEALAFFRESYARAGVVPPLYGAPPGWVRDAVVYEAHPGLFGGFRGLASELPRLAALGVTVLYLLPVWEYDNRSGRAWDGDWQSSGSPYAMRNYEAFDPSLGTGEDFRCLVDEAHRLGLRVLCDFVAQGCAIDARYVPEHPEWFARDEAGNLVSSHGWIDTYSFDWANPDFQRYMLDWSLRLVREYGLDGYRVDAPHGKEPNWARGLPYHASYTSLGVVRLLEQLQTGLKALGPDKAMLCELFGPLFVKTHDFACDYQPMGLLYELFEERVSAQEAGEYLEDYWRAQPDGAVRVCFTETHDTRDYRPPAYLWRGSAAAQAMLAMLVMSGFVPMIWAGQERDQAGFLTRLFAARAGSAALRRGTRRFNAVPADDPRAFSVLCVAEDEVVWGVVGLSPEKRTFTFELPMRDLALDPGRHVLRDLLSGAEVAGFEAAGDAASVRWAPEPFRPYLLHLMAG